MSRRYVVPDDPLSQQMENALLTLEVDFLRARLAELPTSDVDRARIAELEDQVRELAKARSDLRWLLSRLNGSPLAPLLRRFDGFQVLLDRWVDA